MVIVILNTKIRKEMCKVFKFELESYLGYIEFKELYKLLIGQNYKFKYIIEKDIKRIDRNIKNIDDFLYKLSDFEFNFIYDAFRILRLFTEEIWNWIE